MAKTAFKAGQEVEVRWKWERKLLSARAIVEDVKPKRVRVALTADVYVSDNRYYPKGCILRLPAKDVGPPECWTEKDCELQIRAYTEGLSDEDIRFMVEAIADAWNNSPHRYELTDENTFETVFAWIMTVNSTDTRGLTPDEQLWGYYESYVIGFREWELSEHSKDQSKVNVAA